MYLTRTLNGMLIGIVIFIIIYPFFFHKKTIWEQIVTGLIFIYGGAITFLTMLYNPPQYWNISLSGINNAIQNIDIIPFTSSIEIFKNCQSIDYYKDFIVLIGGNLIMLTPIAILFPLLNREKYKFKRVSLLAIKVSFTIEMLQLLTNIIGGKLHRTVEIDDFILNVSGCVLAYLIFDKLGIIKFIEKTATRFQLNRI